MSSMSSRGEHYNPAPGTVLFRQGQSQAKISIERYHILRAALKNQFTTSQVPPNGPAQIFPRQKLDFSAYRDFPLKPVSGIKLHPREDGTIHPEDLRGYRDNFELNWKTQEGGVLYCIAEYREFFNCMLNYHSPAHTTGIPEWDELFRKLKTTGYPKNLIPCMFFGREAGCLDGSCPFLHDKEAVLRSRAGVIAKRRETFDGRPTQRQLMDRARMLLQLEAGDDYRRRAALSAGIERRTDGDRAYCANPECLKPWKQEDAICPLQRCQNCKIVLYCSRECQKTDWKRHKKEPCAPVEQLVENDDIWNPIGTRKGTEIVETNWG